MIGSVREKTKKAVDLHPSKALFSLDPDNLQLHCFLGLGTLFCCLFFFSFRPAMSDVVNGTGRPKRFFNSKNIRKAWGVFDGGRLRQRNLSRIRRCLQISLRKPVQYLNDKKTNLARVDSFNKSG